MSIQRLLPVVALAVAVVLLSAPAARSDTFEVTLNTTPLSGTQTLAFGLTDGDGVANNTVSLSSFHFGGGAAVGSPSYSGSGISGNLGSTVAMTDSGFSALFSQQFNAGSSLSFILTTTNNFAGGTPDAFAMYVCDSTLSTCYSDDASTTAMLVLNLNGTTLTPGSFILNGASAQGLFAPVVSVVTVSTPEPSSLLLLAGALGALGLFGVFKRA